MGAHVLGNLADQLNIGFSVWTFLGILVVPFRVVRTLFRYRHDAGEVTPIEDLQPGMKGLVEGIAACDDPISLAGGDVLAVYARSNTQTMGTRTDDVYLNQVEFGDIVHQETAKVVSETGWKERRRSEVIGTWFQVDDGVHRIWVDGDGAKIDGQFLGTTGRHGNKREAWHAVLANAPVSVQGEVHKMENGLLAIGGPKGKLKKGFFVSSQPADFIAGRRKRGVGFQVGLLLVGPVGLLVSAPFLS